MHIARIPNRSSPPTPLLRESFREGKLVKHRTLANLKGWSEAELATLALALKKVPLQPLAADTARVLSSLPYGQVAAVLGMVRHLGLEQLLAARASRERALVTALVVARVVQPASKFACARLLAPDGALGALNAALGLGAIKPAELYATLDWLTARQDAIEAQLATRHLVDGTLVLYDLTSVVYEGHTCALARRGHPKKGGRGRLQIAFGLLCAPSGCPLAVSVFSGNTADPTTVAAQIDTLKRRFGLAHVVMVGDRGTLTSARLTADLTPAHLGWLTALRSPAIHELVKGGSLQLSLFDQQNLAEISAPAYPGERLIACRNPLLADERARTREDLLAATEQDFARIRAATLRARQPLRGAATIGEAVGAVKGLHKVGKYFTRTITDTEFSYARDPARIAQDVQLDGLYVLRTTVTAAQLSAPQTVAAYKSLSTVERAFRCLKGEDLLVRPIRHRTDERVRGHLALCLLAYHVEWHLRQAWAPLLYSDDDPAGAAAARTSIVAPAQLSPATVARKRRGTADSGVPLHSYQTLLASLGTICRCQVQLAPGLPPLPRVTQPSALHAQALALAHATLTG